MKLSLIFLWWNFSVVLVAYLIKEDIQNVLLLLACKPLRRWRHWAIASSIILWSIAGHTPDVIPPTLWPPNSPDFNLVDYKVSSVMQEQVYQTPIYDVKGLKQRTFVGWVGGSGSEDYRLFRLLKFWQNLIKLQHSIISFYLLNKMLQSVGIILLVQLAKYLESFGMIWPGITYIL